VITVQSDCENGEFSWESVASGSGSLPIVNDNSILNIWEYWGSVAATAPETEAYCTENIGTSFECGGWRDIFILDRKNQPIAIYNLTIHNLSGGRCSDTNLANQTDCEAAGATWTDHFQELKQILINAANQ